MPSITIRKWIAIADSMHLILSPFHRILGLRISLILIQCILLDHWHWGSPHIKCGSASWPLTHLSQSLTVSKSLTFCKLWQNSNMEIDVMVDTWHMILWQRIGRVLISLLRWVTMYYHYHTCYPESRDPTSRKMSDNRRLIHYHNRSYHSLVLWINLANHYNRPSIDT